MALQVTSCTLKNRPDKLLGKGPNYFRERTNYGIQRNCGRRKSAVELLEASKAQYVKSSEVLEHHQELKHGAGDKANTSIREKFPRCAKENDSEGHSFVRPHRRDRKLRYSIGACENIPNALKAPGRSRSATKSVSPLCPQCDQCCQDITSSKSAPQDVSSPLIETCQEHLTMDQEQSSNPTRPLHQRCRHLMGATANSKECVHSSIDLPSDKMLRRQKAIHRSQSDLSSRHSRSSTDFSDLSSRVSRTSVDLEKFFNEMGLEKTVIDPMLRKQSQSFSDFDILETMSSMGSPDGRSICSGVSKSEKTDHTGPEGAEKPINHTSVVERNARIIKWLCNVKKAGSITSSADKS